MRPFNALKRRFESQIFQLQEEKADLEKREANLRTRGRNPSLQN